MCTRILTSFLSLFLFLAASASTLAAPEQPHMDKAIELLQKAKTAPEPIPLLKLAREQVATARANKGGRRPEAIEAINEAIEEVKQGKNPEPKINHAIAMLHSGKDRAH